MRSDMKDFDVIIACSGNDRDVADVLFAALEVNGVRCWYSYWYNLRSGRMHNELPRGALKSCSVMVLVQSASINLDDQMQLLVKDLEVKELLL